MATSNTERIVFAEIQKKLFYMIPEKWEAIYLYASIVEVPFKKPVGEMYFYYIPKGFLKRKPVNVYEIPGLFNIDEESYNELVQRLYMDIKQLRWIHRETKPVLWSNLTITIANQQFKVEYGYEDLGEEAIFSPYERHIIWRYKTLKDNSMIQTRADKEIIERYLNSDLIEFERAHHDVYAEGIYKQQVHNIIDYERTMTLEAAIAAQQGAEEEREKAEKKERKRRKKEIVNVDRSQKQKPEEVGNQILFSRGEKMRKNVSSAHDEVNEEREDDDIILSSDFMRGKKGD